MVQSHTLQYCYPVGHGRPGGGLLTPLAGEYPGPLGRNGGLHRTSARIIQYESCCQTYSSGGVVSALDENVTERSSFTEDCNILNDSVGFRGR